jgi:azurin
MSAYFTDPEAHSLTYSLASGSPTWLAIDSANGKVYNTTAAPSVAAANLAVTVDAFDGVNHATKSFQIDVVAAPVLLTTLDDNAAYKLDVTSNIVLTIDQDVTAVAGKYITINNTGGTGYRAVGVDADHDFVIEATDSRVHIDNIHHTIWIDPSLNFDLDLDNTYTVSVDAGAFKNSTNLDSGAFTFDFATVKPGTPAAAANPNAFSDSGAGILGAQQSYKMDIASGATTAGNKWLDIEGQGNGSSNGGGTAAEAAYVDISAASSFTFVIKDNSAAAGWAGLITATDFSVLLKNFKATDRVYIDDPFNNVNFLNDVGNGDWFAQGNGSAGGGEFKQGLNSPGGDPSLFVQLANSVTSTDSLLVNLNTALGLSTTYVDGLYNSAVIAG